MDQKLEELRAQVSGKVVTPDSSDYDQLRTTHYSHTAKPAVIVMCQSPKDVAAAIAFAHGNKLVLSVRSGGHNGAGLSTNDGGMVIDVTPMHGIEVLDAQNRLVRVGAGAQWGDVAKALEPHGLALTSGDTHTVGVSGLTLGGGLGWMVRKYGLTVDNVVSVDLVTVDGELLHLSKDENPELFWAVRGGGGNFGVATSFEFHAQPVKEIVGGTIIYDFADRAAILKGWADYMRTAPRELTTITNMMGSFMPGAPDRLMITVCYAGDDEAEANKVIAPLLKLGRVVSSDIKKKPYGDMLEEAMLSDAFKVRAHNGFVPKLSHELMDIIAANFAKEGVPIIQIRSLGGAVDDTAKDAMAFCHRGNEGFIIVPTFSPAATDETAALAASDKAWVPLKPFVDGSYCNFFTDSRLSTLLDSFSKETYERLMKIKGRYDPENIFNQNANIEPSLS